MTGRGFWKGMHNEPVVIIHSSIDRWSIIKASKILRNILRFIQEELRQEVVYLEINGRGRAISVVPEETVTLVSTVIEPLQTVSDVMT